MRPFSKIPAVNLHIQIARTVARQGEENMNEQQNIATVQKMYEAFGKGDVQTIVDQLDPNVNWDSHFDKEVPWAGDYTVRVPELFKDIYETVDVTCFITQDVNKQCETVVS